MPRLAVVVGAGPVGCLAALSLAKMGWDVHLYEGRPEKVVVEESILSGRRSINLAISSRGIAALEAIDPDMASRLLESMLPMRGRFVHSFGGSVSRQPYDSTGQCINSVDRGLLNRTLLKEATNHAKIQVLFDHKLITADFDRKIMTLSNGEIGTKIVTFDLCVGADGSYSNVRRQMMRVVRMDFQQEYIPHDYIELHIPAKVGNNGSTEFALDPNYLHIWPRHSFMFIALPNKDKTFTGTLFCPTHLLDRLENGDGAIKWFKHQFTDLVPLIGDEVLFMALTKNPRSSLISVKANPYHYKDTVIILGDAAHSMVPFFGQGLNCGLEDVRILNAIMRLHSVDPFTEILPGAIDDRLCTALQTYSRTRHQDLLAICDLAMENYVEMRHSVTTPVYLLHKVIDNALSKLTPHKPNEKIRASLSSSLFPSSWAGGWLPLYAMVTFRPDLSYATAKKQAAWQINILRGISLTIALGAIRMGLKRINNL